MRVEPLPPAIAGDSVRELHQRFGAGAFVPQATRDGIPTLWVSQDRVREVLRYLKTEARPG
jgi:NADH-quinone oxidoreductase subunit C/D